MNEAWKPISGCAGYEVSNLGRVRSWRKRGYGAGGLLDHPLILKVDINHAGYERVTLRSDDRPCRRAVHQLVLEAFGFMRPSPDHEGAHGDGNRRNNTLDNLRWALPVDNAKDKEAHGTLPIGSAVHSAKLTEDAVRAIRQSAKSHSELAREFGVTHKAVMRARSGETWRHVA